MGITRGPNIVTDGLVFTADAANPSSYPGSGTTWKDLTITQNHGTLTNGPTFDSGNGGSIDFDGTSDFVELGSSNLLTGDNCQNFTLSGWAKWTSTSTGYIASVKRSASDSSLISLTVNAQASNGVAAGNAGMMMRNAANSAFVYTYYNGGYNDDIWHNVVAVVDGSSVKLYVDAIQRGSHSNGMESVTGNTAKFTIGAFAASSMVHDIDGNIAAVSAYRKSLSAEEVLQNYNALKPRFGL